DLGAKLNHQSVALEAAINNRRRAYRKLFSGQLAVQIAGKLTTEELSIGSTAIIDGDLKSNALVIELGAEVSGTIGRKS
ncbi:MAG: polymer-forming cytoskeletal protein, partial [Alphaproteobacteria bacterium]|nr:polymer-forming cytoskeletal protein [Alphaproteobacteria bacterium]